MKRVRTPVYNYNFDETNGYFERWGKVIEDDPQYSPIGCEIVDIEISTKCSRGCKMCYKSNVSTGDNMSFDTFRTIIKKMPTVTQIAFGIGDIDGNKDFKKIVRYCREIGIVPNVTINGYGMTDEWYRFFAGNMGAVAVSNYDRNMCYNAVENLCKAGLKQVNIHQLVAEETKEQCYQVIEDYKNDPRLIGLNAIVFLSLKNKGRGVALKTMSFADYKALITKCFDENIRWGSDSCGANRILESIKNKTVYDKIKNLIEPCESGLFSLYINVEGKAFPCSFIEGTVGWTNDEGLDVLVCEDFLNDIWYHEKMKLWRSNLLIHKRNCPVYKI